jgi:SpoVK/Ycf46/Vps4 family AAA+-type ATPase
MATSQQIIALIQSVGDNDLERFYRTALQIAARKSSKGHSSVAQEIHEAVERSKTKAAPMQVEENLPAGILSFPASSMTLEDIVLPEDTKRQLRGILQEHTKADLLRSHGLEPKRKILLVGPPGTGKTLTASALAGSCNLPLYKVRMESLVTRFLGETAAKLHLIFESMHTSPGVYLFDEFDSLGTQRDSSNDVGEIRRVLSSFLLFLEEDTSRSILVAATNHADMLDKALFRRFDAVLSYRLPDMCLRKAAFRHFHNEFFKRFQDPELLGSRNRKEICYPIREGSSLWHNPPPDPWERIIKETEHFSYADIKRICEEASKEALLNHGTTRVYMDEVLSAISRMQKAKQTSYKLI